MNLPIHAQRTRANVGPLCPSRAKNAANGSHSLPIHTHKERARTGAPHKVLMLTGFESYKKLEWVSRPTLLIYCPTDQEELSESASL
jgi:hypothetical protein